MKNKARFIYPDIPSDIWPVPHNDDIPISIPPDNLNHQNQMMKMKLMMIYHRNTFPMKIKEMLNHLINMIYMS